MKTICKYYANYLQISWEILANFIIWKQEETNSLAGLQTYLQYDISMFKREALLYQKVCFWTLFK